MLNVGVIGIGNCGNQVARLAFTDANCDVFAINTSEDDLATLPDAIPKKCIGDSEGSGKDRKVAQGFLKASIMELLREEEFTKFMSGKDVILVVSSMGGGSGSGAAPIMYEVISSSFRRSGDESPLVTILVGVMPRLAEGESTHANMLGYTKDVYEVLDRPTYMMYDNNNFAKESAPVAIEMVNKEIIEDIKVIQCRYNNPTVYDSIDPKDMKVALSGPGRVVIATLLDIKEKDLDDCSIEDMLIEKLKKSAHAELQRDGVVGNTALITNLDKKLIDSLDTNIPKVRQFVGEPDEEFLHIAVNKEKIAPNMAALILTGLSGVSDRIDKTKERLAEIEQKRAARDAKSVDISDSELEELEGHRNRRKSANVGTQVDIGGIFGKFGV